MSQQRGAYVPIIFDTETTYKSTPGSPSATKFYYTTESVRLNRNLISSKALRGSRQAFMPVRGNVDITGDINFELNPQMGKFMKHIFGGYVPTGSSAPYTHTFSVGTLPVGLVMEKQFVDLTTPKFFKYNGLKINSFKLSAKTEGMIDCSVSLIGAKETVSNSAFGVASDPGYTPFDGFSGKLYVNGVSQSVITEIDLTLENGLDGNSYVFGSSGERVALPEGEAKVTGTFKALFDSIDLYNYAINHQEIGISIEFSLGDGTGGSAGNEKLTFYMDECLLKPQAPVVSGPTGLLVELPFEAFYGNDSDANMFRAVLLTATASF